MTNVTWTNPELREEHMELREDWGEEDLLRITARYEGDLLSIAAM